MKKIFKKIPKFKNEADEGKFWELHDTTDYIDWNRAKLVSFPDLKPTTESISLRLPVSLLTSIKIEANKKDIPYQSYMKMILGQHFK